jgi:hypothetical protein
LIFRYNIKYNVAVQVATGRIVYVSEPDPGSVPDVTALRNCSLFDLLDYEDVILADKGYQGVGNCLTPFKGRNLSAEQKLFNEVHASVRQLGMDYLFLY